MSATIADVDELLDWAELFRFETLLCDEFVSPSLSSVATDDVCGAESRSVVYVLYAAAREVELELELYGCLDSELLF